MPNCRVYAIHHKHSGPSLTRLAWSGAFHAPYNVLANSSLFWADSILSDGPRICYKGPRFSRTSISIFRWSSPIISEKMLASGVATRFVACAFVGAMLLIVLGAPSAYAQGSLSLLPPFDESIVFEPTSPDEVISPSADDYWYDPMGWWQPSPWDSSFEIGINGSEGNARALSLHTAASITRETDATKSTIDLSYSRVQTDSVDTQHNALLDANIDYFIGESLWTLFMKYGVEYDEFRDFDLRLATSGGLGRQLLLTEVTTLIVRAGGGVSRELGGADDSVVPEGIFGFDFERQLTAKQKFSMNVDYLPDWNSFEEYRIESKLSWEILLDEATNLHLKVGIIDRYDSTPGSSKPNDLDYALTFLWKL